MKLASIIMLPVVTATVHAQSLMPVTTTWQVSTDNGSTWAGGLVSVSQSTPSARVRLFVTWGTSPAVMDNFVTGRLTPYITSVDGAGLGDTVSAIQGVRPFLQTLPANVQGRRWVPNQIKIGSNALPFPSGSVELFGSDPLSGISYSGNSLSVIEYTLNLDGTPGTRLLNGLWSPIGASGELNLIVSSVNTPGPYTYSYTFNDTTLVVVPAPSVVAVALGAAVVGLRRRR